jgi:hypothetical protein
VVFHPFAPWTVPTSPDPRAFAHSTAMEGGQNVVH